jgi:signal transduction histidine kinase
MPLQHPLVARYQRRVVPLAAATGIVVAASGPTGALVLAAGGHAGEGERPLLVAASVGAAALGFFVGVIVYVVCMSMVRGLVGQLARAVDAEMHASQDLKALNKMLAQRVSEAKDEVHQLSDKVLLVQEEERRRIARELHDGVGQALAALQIELDFARRNPDEAGKRVAEGARILFEAMGGLRQAVHDLRPPEIGSLPLPEIFATYCERFELRSGIRASFRWRGPVIRADSLATGLLRILQEALTNISRHARATEVGVSVRVGEGAVELQVHDDGLGFDAETPKSGTGLRGMRERCAFFGGEMSVESQSGAGTRLLVRIPLVKSALAIGAA